MFFINFDSYVNYNKEKEEWKGDNWEHEFESESNYGTFNSGFGVEDEKNIHLLTPKNKFQKGFFAYANYSAYLWKNRDGEPIKGNPKNINISIKYAYLNDFSNLMMKPYFHYNIEIESELNTSTIGLNSLWDISHSTQLQIDINNRFSEDVRDFTFDFLINLFRLSYIDIYLNYNLSTYDSNWDGILDGEDKMLSTFGGGLGFFWGYN